MGLEEKRRIKELQEVTLPERVREIEEICGAPIPYNVDWDSLANDAAGLNFLDNLSCHRLNMALRTICADDLGKEAIRESLTSVKLVNVADVADKSIVFADGVLEMHCAYAQGAEGMIPDSEIHAVLMAGL